MLKIKNSVIESICLAAKNSFPNEFIALLGGNVSKKSIEELVILPAISGSNFASIRMDLLPLEQNIFGTVHSHPSYSNNPSRGDLQAFLKTGKIHLIICNPFTEKNIKLFDFNGKNLEFEAVD